MYFTLHYIEVGHWALHQLIFKRGSKFLQFPASRCSKIPLRIPDPAPDPDQHRLSNGLFPVRHPCTPQKCHKNSSTTVWVILFEFSWQTDKHKGKTITSLADWRVDPGEWGVLTSLKICMRGQSMLWPLLCPYYPTLLTVIWLCKVPLHRSRDSVT